jgi:hypothetical protein
MAIPFLITVSAYCQFGKNSNIAQPSMAIMLDILNKFDKDRILLSFMMRKCRFY